jgi:hypothetical protein
MNELSLNAPQSPLVHFLARLALAPIYGRTGMMLGAPGGESIPRGFGRSWGRICHELAWNGLCLFQVV